MRTMKKIDSCFGLFCSFDYFVALSNGAATVGKADFGRRCLI